MNPMSYLDESVIWWLVALSVVMFVGSLIVIPWLVVRIPADYFARSRRSGPAFLADRPALRMLLRAAGNVAGVVFVLAGILMLLIPGQGILTMVLGLLLMNFPGKYRLKRWLILRPGVRSAINRMRRRAGRQPLQVEEAG